MEDIIAYTIANRPPTRDQERKLKEVIEMFLSWTGALAVTGSVEPNAWRELVAIRFRAEKAMSDD